jgi:undecaprenyl-diphosphatase
LYRPDEFRAVPVLDREPGAVGRRLARLPAAGHPVFTYATGVLLSWCVIAATSILLGLLVTKVLLHVHGVASDDGWLDRVLAHHRDGALDRTSLVGSTMAGGVVLPALAAVYVLVAVLFKHWRLAAFIPCALLVESGSYRATTMVVHRHRPNVIRLEHLPVNASYPSGHTAASIAVYGGLALLAASSVRRRWVQVVVWAVAVLIPIFVAFSRIYRGMHHPLDVVGGIVIGVAALIALVAVSRASRLAALQAARR